MTRPREVQCPKCGEDRLVEPVGKAERVGKVFWYYCAVCAHVFARQA